MSKVISIHALCEEGDLSSLLALTAIPYFYPRPLRGGRPKPLRTSLQPAEFLSTPSARRATVKYPAMKWLTSISIHALCEEGDA